VAANQASIGLQEARFRSQQERIAGELDLRVAQRTAELAAANAELQLQVELLQRLPVSAWTLKPDGTPDFVNQVWLEFAGQTLDFVRSHPEAWMTAVHPEDREIAAKNFWEGIRSGKDFAFETRSLRAKDDSYRWHLQQAVALRDAEGKVLKFVGTTTDIDDQKRAQEELRASEGKLQRVIDTIPTLAWCNLPDGPNEFLSKSWHAYTGLSPEEAHGWGWTVAFHPEDLPPLMEKWKKMLVSGESDEIEARLRRHDGVYRWFLIRAQAFRDDSGKIVRWYGTSTDIEDRKQAEEALAASEQNLRLIINTMPTLAWSAKNDGNVDFVNQRWLDYTGLSPVQAQGWGWSRAFHPDDVGRLNNYWLSTIAAGQPGEIEARLRRSDGRYRWFLFRASPLRNESGAIVKWYGTNTDIDDRKRAEEELRNAQSELARVTRVMTMGQLTASIAHEVNQPLSGIITNANTCLRMLDANPPNVEGARETARRTIRDGIRASDVITRLRTLYSKREPALESMDLNEAAREVTALSATEIQRNGVTLRQEFADDLPPALGDRIQLQQVILNLLRNAADAMSTIDDRPRELLVRTERDEGNQVRLSVKDSGIGFAPQDADKMFTAFHTTKTDGMGIGLSISRSIIEAHQGHLWAARNDGPGSTFSFSIPCRSEGLADSELRVDRTGLSEDAA
jgi:PAS domain S-box-containing protein